MMPNIFYFYRLDMGNVKGVVKQSCGGVFRTKSKIHDGTIFAKFYQMFVKFLIMPL